MIIGSDYYPDGLKLNIIRQSYAYHLLRVHVQDGGRTEEIERLAHPPSWI